MVSEQGTYWRSRPFLAGERREFDLELAQHLVDAEADELRPHCAGVEPRDVEQRAENLLDRVERGIDIADQADVLAVAFAVPLLREVT